MDTLKPKKTNKHWGCEELLVVTEKYAMKRITITRGKRMSLQYHELKEETIYVVSGLLIIWKSEDCHDRVLLDPGDVYHVKPGHVHRFGAPDQTDTIIIECSTCELDDVVRLADDYGRS